MSKSNGKLRFGALIRVSTEQQEQRGESLRTQETQITEAVDRLSGEITRQYAGQEHATEGWEREQLEELLADTSKKNKPFDAVIVADPSRWSRDNLASERGLEVLRDNGIRFFVLTQEHDLYSDDARLFLSLQATINSYQARVQTRKSLENRIHRAKRSGIPTCGTQPYGRYFDKKAGRWEVDEEARATMRDIATRYLAGESLKRLAEEHGIKETTIYDRLAKCGKDWPVNFHSDKLNIDESFTIEIPELLDEDTIRAIRKRSEANKTFSHGQLKHQYLFSRMVFCGHCKSAMSGQFSNGHRYYRHAPRKENCLKSFVRAEDLEAVVIRQLFECFGNVKAVQRAIEEATPNTSKVDELLKRKERLAGQLQKNKLARAKLMRALEADLIPEQEVMAKLEEIKTSEAKQRDDLAHLDERLATLPSSAAIRAVAKQISASFMKRRARRASTIVWAEAEHANGAFDEMTWDEQRALAESVFGGKTLDGDRMGIYVHRLPEQRRRWGYTIHGHLINVDGRFPMSEDRLGQVFHFGAAHLQNDLLTKLSLVTTPAPY